MTPTVLNLRARRERAGLTQEALAERAGVRQATISDLETGKSRRIDLDILERIAKALGCEPGELIASVKGRPRKE
ncbi:MAG TPA: helix-turn-helix transcriptional regulator [Gemmatimonadales bacterium]